MSNIQEYKCPNCGGAVSFNSASQNMKCPYCDSEFSIEALKETQVEEDKADWNIGSQIWEENGMQSFICNSCGGELIADANTVATTCPYCDNPVTLNNRSSGMLKPDFIIPFKLNKEQAKAKLKEHLKGKVLLPNSFASENHIDEIKGVYVPFWLFTTSASGTVHFRGQKTRRWSSGDYNYTEHNYFTLLRSGNASFDKVPVDGSSKMPDDLMESIEPFNPQDLTEFQNAYLAGYLADKYDVSAAECAERANERIKESLVKELKETTRGYEAVTPTNASINLSNAQIKYALYPVWILNTTYKGKKYTFAMNGQTGKFVGNLPMDKGKLWKYYGIVAAAASVLLSVVAYFVI